MKTTRNIIVKNNGDKDVQVTALSEEEALAGGLDYVYDKYPRLTFGIKTPMDVEIFDGEKFIGYVVTCTLFRNGMVN